MKTALRASRRSTISQRLKRGLPLNTPLPYAYSGAPVSIVVPSGARAMVVDLNGAQGGFSGQAGGLGGRVQATIPVTPGETLELRVGGQGSVATGGYNGGGAGLVDSTTGYGGGGATDIRRLVFGATVEGEVLLPQPNWVEQTWGTYSGGKAALTVTNGAILTMFFKSSGTATIEVQGYKGAAAVNFEYSLDGAAWVPGTASAGSPSVGTLFSIAGLSNGDHTLRLRPTGGDVVGTGLSVDRIVATVGQIAYSNRLAVAGGGGGLRSSAATPETGHGGGTSGATGTSGSAGAGQGGTQAAGGSFGALSGSGGNGQSGSIGQGGRTATFGSRPGGGGGGGYYGGGGGGSASSGSGGGGGGGSSYVTAEAADVTHTQGARSGHGSATITFQPNMVASFAYTGSPQSIVVPSWATSMLVDIYGAAGADYAGANKQGLGGRLEATIPVTPGETLQINVGGQGTKATSGAVGPTVGGWNGGGDVQQFAGGRYGMGGGGATDIRRGAFALGNRIAVAGGGGGAPSSETTPAGTGGHGGGTVGVDGTAVSAVASLKGSGGTQSAGGASGSGGQAGGSAGLEGEGGVAGRTSWGQAGAGGGGYFGGGGGNGINTQGNGGGGGGGSSYVTAGASDVTHTQGVRSGHGVATITFS